VSSNRNPREKPEFNFCIHWGLYESPGLDFWPKLPMNAINYSSQRSHTIFRTLEDFVKEPSASRTAKKLRENTTSWRQVYKPHYPWSFGWILQALYTWHRHAHHPRQLSLEDTVNSESRMSQSKVDQKLAFSITWDYPWQHLAWRTILQQCSYGRATAINPEIQE